MNFASHIASGVLLNLLILVAPVCAWATEKPLVGNGAYLDSASAKLGKVLFDRQWKPNNLLNGGGLGPLYNARSCVSCHINHGRGRPPFEGENAPSFLIRLSVAPSSEAERMSLALDQKPLIGHRVFGVQLQPYAIDGHKAEGSVKVRYVDKPFKFDDGSVVTLHRPVYSVMDNSGKILNAGTMISPRMAQPVRGMGQLDAVPEHEILKYEDPRDEDGDGISGRANRVKYIRHKGSIAVGRFGWKATQPNLGQQTASAFSQDMGLTSQFFFPENSSACKVEASKCLSDKSNSIQQNYELRLDQISSVVEYLRKQSMPTKLNSTGKELAGKRLFAKTGCAACHRPSMSTKFVLSRNGKSYSLPIFPYSDLLLHDMGAALADHRPVAQASGWEWRTQPLWGIGKAGEINGNKFFLHDGRARSITEAILWHGGEARISREKFAALNKKQRAALIEFVEGL